MNMLDRCVPFSYVAVCDWTVIPEAPSYMIPRRRLATTINFKQPPIVPRYFVVAQSYLATQLVADRPAPPFEEHTWNDQDYEYTNMQLPLHPGSGSQ